MKKRYIDFVPARGGVSAKNAVAKKPAKVVAAKPAAKSISKPAAKPAPKKVISRKEVPMEELFAEKPVAKSVDKPATKPAAKPVAKTKLGVIEDYTPKMMTKKPVAAKPVAKKPAYVAPRPVFLNTNKVVKRPLSNSTPVRKQPVVPPREVVPAKPEKIITKPEKDSKAGLIIAIILTIILGAAAGTIAFLLLPK